MLTVGTLGTGSDARRKAHVAKRISPKLFRELRDTTRKALSDVTAAVFEEIHQGLEAEFDKLSMDLHSMVVERGEVSESQRFPETAAAIDTQLNEIDPLITRCREIIRDLSR